MREHEFRTFRGYELLRQENRALLTPTQEDYLEMIYRHCLLRGHIRINELAEELNVAAPSVTRLTKKLCALGFLEQKRYGYVTLTDAGRAAGEFLLARHNTVQDYLAKIGVQVSQFVDAELIEHCVSEETLRVMNAWLEFFRANPDVLQRFGEASAASKATLG